MGENLVLNLESRRFQVAVFNRTADRTRQFAAARGHKTGITPTYELGAFVRALETPRRIILFVKAGEAVDALLTPLAEHLSRDDVVADAGNSHFRDTERRLRILGERGIRFLGLGVSGGAEGALRGPCLMAGGDESAYQHFAPVLTAIAARVQDEACTAYLGPGGAGHFVKMVHNGIEYAVLELLAEVYDFLRRGLGLPVEDVRELFVQWRTGELSSYLMEATARVLQKIDEVTGTPLVELILDAAEQKGTGKWTSQTALDLGVPIPTIDAAVAARYLSARKDERQAASSVLKLPWGKLRQNPRALIPQVQDALYCAILTAYAQGFALLRAAAAEYAYAPNLDEVARIWRGGCIIRASLLDLLRPALAQGSGVANLLLAPLVAKVLLARHRHWRRVVQEAKALGLPAPALSSTLDYFDGYRSDRLPANLIQALRDAFGMHGYRRVDRTGTFHTEW
jgi:6-phosphogluconate dehydrogenase